MQYLSRSNSWRRRLGVGLVAGALVIGACSGDDDAEDDSTATAEPGETTTTTIDPSLIAPLTGVIGEDTVPERSALIVKIDNAEKARPHAGIGDADIVIEERVEGDQTRLMAVFHSTIPDQVGPVRSTRSTDFDLIGMFGRPIYASSGGNEGVMSNLADVEEKFDVGHNQGDEGFERDGNRPAPHNLFATPETLIDRAGDDADQPPDLLFEYRRAGDELPDSAEEASSVGLSFDKVEAVTFEWDADDEVWLRSQRGSEHVDVDGEQLAPVNVVVLQIEYTFTEVVGTSNPHGVTTGEGTAMVFTDGHVIDGTWSRPKPGDPFELLDEDGEAIELTPGQTFIELPAKSDPVTVG